MILRKFLKISLFALTVFTVFNFFSVFEEGSTFGIKNVLAGKFDPNYEKFFPVIMSRYDHRTGYSHDAIKIQQVIQGDMDRLDQAKAELESWIASASTTPEQKAEYQEMIVRNRNEFNLDWAMKDCIVGNNARCAQLNDYSSIASWAGSLKDIEKCSGFKIAGCVLKDVAGTLLDGVVGIAFKIINAILFLVISIEKWIFIVIAGILNMSIEFSVNLSNFTNPINGALNTVWGVIRDIFNVIFIFGLLYVAIGTILRWSSVKTKEMLGQIIMAAILINFSMFMTKSLIDISNSVSSAMYNNILTKALPNSSSPKLADAFMEATGLSSVNAESSGGNDFTIAIDRVSTIILLYFSIFIFITISFLFLVRGALFIVLIITSPIAIAGSIIPFTRSYAKDWVDTLNSQLIVAPIFFIFLKIALVVASKGANGQDGFSSLPKLTTENGIDLSQFFKFALVLGILAIGVSVTKKASGKVGEMMTQVAKTAVGVVAGVATGGAALGLSAIAGGAASRLAGSKAGAWLKEKNLQGGVGGRLASMALRATDAAQKGTFDVRNTAVGQFVQKKTGVDMSKGVNVLGMSVGAKNKTTYQSRIDETAKGYSERIKLSENLSEIRAKNNIDNIKKEDLERVRRENTENKEDEIKKKYDDKVATLKAEKDALIREKGISVDVSGMENEIRELESKAREERLNMSVENLSGDFSKERKQLEDKIKKEQKDLYEEAKTSFIKKVESGAAMSMSSKTGKRMVADKLRKLAKEKTDEEKFAELAKKMRKAEEEKEKKSESGGEKPTEEAKEKDKK